jgi:hypothetical protein
MAILLDPSDEAATNGSPHEHAAPRRSELPLRPSQAVLRNDFWTAAAPKRLRNGAEDADAAWNVYWSKRSAPASVSRLVHAAGTPLLWGWNAAALTEECRALIDLADELGRGADPKKFAKGKRQAALHEAVASWLDAARDGDTNVSFAIGCLAAAHLLNQLGEALGPELGWRLLDFLAITAEEAKPWNVDADGPAAAALSQQLVAGELSLTLAYMSPEMAPLAALARVGRKRLAEGVEELTGDEGIVRAGHLEVFRGLVACWTRSCSVGGRLEKGPWKSATQKAFSRVVRQALRWTRAADGRTLLAGNDATAWSADFLAAAVREGSRTGDGAAAKALLASASLTSEVPSTRNRLPHPASWSEPAGLALLRTRWSPCAATVAIDFAALGMKFEVSAEGQSLFDGVWTTSSRIDGKIVKPAGEWQEVCWFSDADVDFIEFVLELEDGAKLERQVLLARKDGFLFLADYLQAPRSAALEHDLQLPLAGDFAWCGESETRDGTLSVTDSESPAVRILPLALPEWRIDPRVGELASVDNTIRLVQSTQGRSMACPLFLDLKPSRAGKPCTWRQLTVAELLVIQPPDVAVAYRVQCGKKQWVIYRSQTRPGNRTFLGQNTSNEFYAARFLAPGGEVEELVQVEGMPSNS